MDGFPGRRHRFCGYNRVIYNHLKLSKVEYTHIVHAFILDRSSISMLNTSNVASVAFLIEFLMPVY